MKSFAFDLVTPEAALYSGEATLVTAPGTLGDFGVMAGHAAFVSTLRLGVVKVEKDGDVRRFFVESGVAEVNSKAFTILAEKVVDLASFTRAQAEDRLAKAKAALDVAKEDDKKLAAQEMAFAQALVNAAA